MGKAVVLAREVATARRCAAERGPDDFLAELAGRLPRRYVASAAQWHGGQTGREAGRL